MTDMQEDRLSDEDVANLIHDLRYFGDALHSDPAKLWKCPFLDARRKRKPSQPFLDFWDETMEVVHARACEIVANRVRVPFFQVERTTNGDGLPVIIIKRRGEQITVNLESCIDLENEFNLDKEPGTVHLFQQLAKSMAQAGLFTRDEWCYDMVRELFRILGRP